MILATCMKAGTETRIGSDSDRIQHGSDPNADLVDLCLGRSKCGSSWSTSGTQTEGGPTVAPHLVPKQVGSKHGSKVDLHFVAMF